MPIHVPSFVPAILSRLESGGFEAYLVGGCVRDMLRGVQPSDWDICTSALPWETAALFARTIPTGAKHGTITVLIEGNSAEVTTFRRESDYSDHRRPDSVEFVSDLQTDLSRRDFTINAVAMSLRGQLTDPFGGREDVEKRLIRCVGDPELRFAEDSLRMLRALRFSAALDFGIAPETMRAIEKLAPVCPPPSAERARDELLKMLLSDAPQTVGRAMACGLIPFCSAGECDLTALRAVPAEKLFRLTAFCFALMKASLISSPNRFLSSLRLENAAVSHVSSACAILASGFPKDEAGIKRALRASGSDAVVAAAAASGEADTAALRRVLSSGECWSPRSLAVTGDDLAALGISGRSLGAELSRLLEHVIEHPGDNQRNILLNLAQKRSGLH